MSQLLPITLLGDNLGQRHRYFNSQVDQVSALYSFQDIEYLPERAPVDRLFKIDVAIKLKNVDYIVKNIKDDDMLYVSRALKCKWLLGQRDIINPTYLEEILFPYMVIPAISKMKHWLYINLRDPLICQEFYQYYKGIQFEFAVKFLNQCDIEFVLNEFPKIITKITPHYLKVLGEKSPNLIKMYFDSLRINNELVKRYLIEEEKFYNSIKWMWKSNSDIFLDITEKYYCLSSKLSPSATEYILRFHKNRFTAKLELYIVYLLHIPTVARCLNVEECQDIVIKLARADYLVWWFSYKNVEPLVKRICPDKRAAFKKRVFIEKDIGVHVAEWPYALPTSPVADDTSFEESHVFHDQEFTSITIPMSFGKRPIMKKKGNKYECVTIASESCLAKSELQKLFDEFRFMGFEGTLHELKERISTTSSADRRRDILLVLVSKSGGRADAVRAVLQLTLRLRNEPVHERAAIVRSLVKRASVWRLPQNDWDAMLEYARGLGLDGTESEADCREGLDAVVIRQLIATGDCDPAVRTAFLDNFSTFADYKLVENERALIGPGLQHILVTAATDAEPEKAARHLAQLLDVLEKYKMPFESSPAVSAIAALAEIDLGTAEPLLMRLYEARVGRRELHRQFLKCRSDDAALLNALRHDPAAFTPEWLIQILIMGKTRASKFLLKLAVYFTEKGGTLEHIRQALLKKIVDKPDVKLATALATLAGSDLSYLWYEQDVAGHDKWAAALRANMHRARPIPNALDLGWRKAGMKALAWRAMRCRPVHVTQLVQSLLDQRVKRTVRLALILAQRTDSVAHFFSTAVTIRPVATLRAALLYYRKFGDAADPRIWDIVKSLILSPNLIIGKGLHYILSKVEWVPKAIKPDYCAILYLAFVKISNGYGGWVLRKVKNFLPEISDDLLDNVLLEILNKMDKNKPIAFPAIVIRYLMLSKNEATLKTRLCNIGDLFLLRIETFCQGGPTKRRFFSDNVNQILCAIQYNFAFFDITYQCCLPVIEWVLTWLGKFMTKETHFLYYYKIHATILYYKAVRHSMEQKQQVFEDLVKKMSEGVDIVGFTFGRYIANEVAELKTLYFKSVIEIYLKVFIDYLNKYFLSGRCREKFIAAVMKGILAERETRLAIRILQEFRYGVDSPVVEEIKEIVMKSKDKEILFFLYSEVFGPK